jgi:hypothetical protein
MNINQVAKLIANELDHFQEEFHPEGGALGYAAQALLSEEPLIGYALAEGHTGHKTTILLCRNVIPLSIDPVTDQATYASYLSPLGRIITGRDSRIRR